MTDDLDDLDLHAWRAPQPPRGLADAVITRVTATDEAIAVAVRRRRLRYGIAGGACAVAAAAGVAIWLGVRPSATAPAGERLVFADGPRHVELAGAAADLAPAAAIRTYRDGDTLHAVQSGTVTWHVAPQQKLVIGAGSSASIEATGASLRVEANMNLADIRVVSGAALTAAAVAFATVTVYEGHVKATSGGEGVIVMPGQDVAVAPGKAPYVQVTLDGRGRVAAAPVGTELGADLAITAGESVSIYTDGVVRVEVHGTCADGLSTTVKGSTGVVDSYEATDTEAGAYAAFELPLGHYIYTADCPWQQPHGGTLDVVPQPAAGPVVIAQPARGSVFPDGGFDVRGTIPADATAAIGSDAVALQPAQDAQNGVRAFSIHTFGLTVALRVDRPAGTQFYVLHSALPNDATTDSCDEVSCVLDNYESACCAKFRSPQAGAATPMR